MQAGNETPLRRILVVDDCPVQRQLLSLTLEAAGYSVLVATSGEEALDAARHGHFDAFILDVNMPGMDGPQLGRALRADPVTGASLIVMHSSESETAVRQRFAGFDGFFRKSTADPQIAKRLGSMIEGHRPGGERLPRHVAQPLSL
jgi:CheY-like chemotaxis protein